MPVSFVSPQRPQTKCLKLVSPLTYFQTKKHEYSPLTAAKKGIHVIAVQAENPVMILPEVRPTSVFKVTNKLTHWLIIAATLQEEKHLYRELHVPLMGKSGLLINTGCSGHSGIISKSTTNLPW